MEAVPRVVRPLQDVRCCDGDAVTLETLFDAPPACLVRWEKQGHVIKENSDVSSEWDGARARLRIRSVYPEDEGEYSCIVYNDMGKTVTSAAIVVEMADDKENDVTVQMEHRPDLSRRTTPSRTTPSRYSRSPSVTSFTRRRYTPEPSARSKQRRAHGPKFYYIPHDRIVEEGDTVTFQCAVKGHPTPRISWDKDSVKLLAGGRYKMEERNEVRTIEIPKVTQQDAGLYRVTIENDLGREQATARLDVIKASSNKYMGYVRNWHTAPLTAPRFTRTLPFTSIRDGGRMKLSTDFKGSPSPRAKWYKNNELLPNCPEFEQTCTNTSACLELASVGVQDAGTYTCVIINDKGRAQCSCQVTVEYRRPTPGAPQFVEGLKHDTALDGDPLRLGITLNGSQPMKVLWVKDDEIIEPSGRVHMESSATSGRDATDGGCQHWLQFDEVIPDDSGLYFCEAYNKHGEAYSCCRLKVLDPLDTAPSPPTIIGAFTPLVVRERARARFRVTVTGHPRPALSWELDGQPVVPSQSVQVTSHETDEGLVAYLSFPSARTSDSGTVSLTARNAAGTQTAHTSLYVISEADKERPHSFPRNPGSRRSVAEAGILPSATSSLVTSKADQSASKTAKSATTALERKSRSPVKQKTTSSKAKSNTATKVTKNGPISSSISVSSPVSCNGHPVFQKTVSSSSSASAQSSPQILSPRAGVQSSPSPHLTYQFKSSSASTSKSSLKSRSSSPVSITTRLCRRESVKSTNKCDATEVTGSSPTTKRLRQELNELITNGFRDHSPSKSDLQSPTEVEGKTLCDLRGRPPIAKSSSKSTVVSRTLSSQVSRSVSPRSSKSPSPLPNHSTKKSEASKCPEPRTNSTQSSSVRSRSESGSSESSSSSNRVAPGFTTSTIPRKIPSPLNCAKAFIPRSAVQRSQSLRTPLRSSVQTEARKLAPKLSLRAASLESRPKVVPRTSKDTSNTVVVEASLPKVDPLPTSDPKNAKPTSVNVSESHSQTKQSTVKKPKSNSRSTARLTSGVKPNVEERSSSSKIAKTEPKVKSVSSRKLKAMASPQQPREVAPVDARSKRSSSPSLAKETPVPASISLASDNSTDKNSLHGTTRSQPATRSSKVSALRDKFNQNSESNSRKAPAKSSTPQPKTFIRKFPVENTKETFTHSSDSSSSTVADTKTRPSPPVYSKILSTPEMKVKSELDQSSTSKYSKSYSSNGFSKSSPSAPKESRSGSRVADISSRFNARTSETPVSRESPRSVRNTPQFRRGTENSPFKRTINFSDSQYNNNVCDASTPKPVTLNNSSKSSCKSEGAQPISSRHSSKTLVLEVKESEQSSNSSSSDANSCEPKVAAPPTTPTMCRPTSLVLTSVESESSTEITSYRSEIRFTSSTKPSVSTRLSESLIAYSTSTSGKTVASTPSPTNSFSPSSAMPPSPSMSSNSKSSELTNTSVALSPAKPKPPSPPPPTPTEPMVKTTSKYSEAPESQISEHSPKSSFESDSTHLQDSPPTESTEIETHEKLRNSFESNETELNRMPNTDEFPQPLEGENVGDENGGDEEEDEEEGAQIVSGPEDVIVTKGQSATLTLRYNGNPPPEVTWLKKDQILRDDERYSVETSAGKSSLTIHNVTADDSAKYTAVVRNCFSAHAGFASLAVEDVPQAPAAQPNLSEVGAGCVTLSWYGPAYDGGSVVTGYTVQTRKVGQVQWTTLVEKWHSTSYKVTGQEVGEQYEYRVMAQNVHGLSEPSKPSQPITLEGTEGRDEVDGSTVQSHEEDEEEDDDGDMADFEHSVVTMESGKAFAERYDLHEEVGKGRFGIVYRCTEKLTNKNRAAKIIKCITSKEKTKVNEEISIMNSLRHPKLLQLAAAFERQKDVVMVMEYIAGGELFERVVADDFTLTERDVVLFMRQICEGVQYMHSNNILHLDLKPENILCVRKTSHKIKLIDFGLARRFNPAQPCRVLFGTPEFIAPEIINFEPISFASDMWSVGVICYVLLSGLSPFMGDNDAETFANITRAEFDFDDDAFHPISDLAKGFITSLLVNRKEDRLTSQGCLQHPWLTKTEGAMYDRVIPTDKLKKFIIRRKWQKTGNAIRALGRITSLTTNRRNSRSSSPTCLSPLPEQQPYSPTSSAFPLFNGDKKSCPSVRGNSVVSERSDSGISECSLTVDEVLSNASNILKGVSSKSSLTNGTPPAGNDASTKHSSKRIEWQSSVDSAVSDILLNPITKTPTRSQISRDALLDPASSPGGVSSHSRV